MAGLSIRGYARRRGVSHTAVRKALNTGRITAGADGSIDPALADAQWGASTDLSKPRNSVTGVPRKRRAPGAPSDPLGMPGPEALSAAPGVMGLASSYAASRAAREAYEARLSKLEFEEKSGKLVDADQVRAQLFALSRRVRDQLLGLPDRLAPVLVGRTDQAEVHALLAQEILSCLAELSAAPPITPGTGARVQ